VTYDEIQAAKTVLLVGFEPEDESPIVFLRLRKAVRKTRTAVFAIAPLASRGLEKLGGTLITASPGTEAKVLQTLVDSAGSGNGASGDIAAARAGLDAEGALILVGERLGSVPGALSPRSRLPPAAVHGWRGYLGVRESGERSRAERCPTCCPAVVR